MGILGYQSHHMLISQFRPVATTNIFSSMQPQISRIMSLHRISCNTLQVCPIAIETLHNITTCQNMYSVL